MSPKEDMLCPCAMPGIEEYRLLTFPDGVQVRLKGVIGFFEDACREGKRPDRAVAVEILDRLSEVNYIPASARADFEALIRKEYGKFVEVREGNGVCAAVGLPQRAAGIPQRSSIFFSS